MRWDLSMIFFSLSTSLRPIYWAFELCTIAARASTDCPFNMISSLTRSAFWYLQKWNHLLQRIHQQGIWFSVFHFDNANFLKKNLSTYSILPAIPYELFIHIFTWTVYFNIELLSATCIFDIKTSIQLFIFYIYPLQTINPYLCCLISCNLVNQNCNKLK